MNKLRAFWNSMFDIRSGEGGRMVYIGLYLVLVLFAYYILKPVSRAMFIHEFDIDELPYLYILIAAAGGVMAYFYTKLAIRSSLRTAVNVCTFGMIGVLVLIWHLLSYEWDWMLYVFNAFVSLFSITLVSQGWLIAANIFTTREAKRLYGVLGVGAVIGAAFGGTFTAFAVYYLGTRHLLLASAAFVCLAWLAFLAVSRQPGVALKQARGAEEEETFTFRDLGNSLARHRHLQVITAIIALTYVVDVTVEYQFSAIAKLTYPDRRELTSFLASFFGIWLNLVTFVLQFFLTAFVVSRFGVGGALQIMPIAVGTASLFTFAAPGIWSTGAARLAEAATRYSFNRTGMELLYLPLPAELRNRTKAFTDIFVDRFSRGIGGILLLLMRNMLNLSIKQLSLVVLGYCVAWIFLSIRARNEYVSTVRKRLELGRLDLESLRVNVNDAATIRLLEETAAGPNARQASYALGVLAETRGYHIERLLGGIIESRLPEVRGKVFAIAGDRGIRGFDEQATAELRNARHADDHAAIKPAVEYALAAAEDPAEMASRLLSHVNPIVRRGTIEALARYPAAASRLITKEWIAEAASSPDPNQRALAAVGIRVRGDSDTSALYTLLRDDDPRVVTAACRTAGILRNRSYLDGLLRLLPNARLRGEAIDALAAFGDRIVGTLGDVLLDTTTVDAVRRQIPRVLRKIPTQRSVDVLMAGLGEQDLTVRSSVLRALSVVREQNSKLNYGRESVLQFISNESRYYYEMKVAISPFQSSHDTPAARLLYETLSERLRSSLERLFRLLGLRYPPKEIYAAYLAVNRKRSEETTAAIEFLDNVLERELKRYILPLLDEDSRLTEIAHDVFGLEPRDSRSALRELIRSGDSWLVACAIATAAELRLSDLRPEIESLSRRAGTEVGPVAESALATLA